MPLHCTAIGKALLANAPDDVVLACLSAPLERRAARTITAPGLLREQLAAVRESGVAFEFEESAAGIACVAAPIADPAGVVFAAVSATGPLLRFDPHKHASHVRAAAAGIQTTLARRAALRPPA